MPLLDLAFPPAMLQVRSLESSTPGLLFEIYHVRDVWSMLTAIGPLGERCAASLAGKQAFQFWPGAALAREYGAEAPMIDLRAAGLSFAIKLRSALRPASMAGSAPGSLIVTDHGPCVRVRNTGEQQAFPRPMYWLSLLDFSIKASSERRFSSAEKWSLVIGIGGQHSSIDIEARDDGH